MSFYGDRMHRLLKWVLVWAAIALLGLGIMRLGHHCSCGTGLNAYSYIGALVYVMSFLMMVSVVFRGRA